MRLFLSITMLLFASVPVVAQGASNATSSYPVAGVHPDQRPEGAPVIREVQRTKDWEKRFYKGISKPYPPHLGAADQGMWYSPFSRPGMTGPYDLRGWHQTGKAPRENGKSRS